MLNAATDEILGRWTRHRSNAIWLGVRTMQVLGVLWLGYEFWRLLWAPDPIWSTSYGGAWDLYKRRYEMDFWFGDARLEHAAQLYPPASYVMLWPIIGWLPMPAVRVVWAALSLACVFWIARLTVDGAGARLPHHAALERRFLWWVPLSMYATGAGIGNGQHVVHVLPMTLAAIFMARRPAATWGRDVAAAALFVGALVKPQLSAPFFWLLLIAPGRWRPAVLTVVGYATFTAVALAFQPINPLDYYTHTLPVSVLLGGDDAIRYADLGIWLYRLGLHEWTGPITLSVLVGLGAWTWRHRSADIWLLLGVTAIVTRCLMYHRWYDDLLLLLPLISLFRLSMSPGATPRAGLWPGLIFVVLWVSLLAPGLLYLLPFPYNHALAVVQAALWIGVLGYLAVMTRRTAR